MSTTTQTPDLEFYVDGHYIFAPDEATARAEIQRFYDYDPEIVRPWTAEDQASMDADAWTEDDEEFDSPYSFAHEDEPDRYRDLWNENMPRVSGHMYFAIPGEQPIHVTDEEAHHIMTYLSEANR